MRLNTHSTRTIPMAQTKIAAGIAVEIADEHYPLDVNELITGGRDGFAAYEVTGDSGADEIPHGCMVFVDTTAAPKQGQPIAVLLNGLTCVKKFSNSGRGLYLISANTAYRPVEIKPQDSFRVLGVVKSHLILHR